MIRRPSVPSCVLAVLLLVAPLCAGCRTAAGDAAPNGAGKQDEHEVLDKQAELQQKELELEIARLDAQSERAGAREALAAAERELVEAERALALFRDHERALTLEEGQNSIARARQHVQETRQELEETEKHYAKDAFGDEVQELVLSRHRARLRLDEQELAIEEAKLGLVEAQSLPQKERELDHALAAAREAVREATHALAHQEQQAKLTLLQLEHELGTLRRELAELDPDADEQAAQASRTPQAPDKGGA